MELTIEFKYRLNADRDVCLTAVRYPDVTEPWHLFSVDDQSLKREHPKLAKIMSSKRIDPTLSGDSGGTFSVQLKKSDQHEYLTHSGRFWFKDVLLEPEAAVGVFVSGQDPDVPIAAFKKENQRLGSNKKFNKFIASIPEQDRLAFKARAIGYTLEQLYEDFMIISRPLERGQLRNPKTGT